MLREAMTLADIEEEEGSVSISELLVLAVGLLLLSFLDLHCVICVYSKESKELVFFKFFVAIIGGDGEATGRESRAGVYFYDRI